MEIDADTDIDTNIGMDINVVYIDKYRDRFSFRKKYRDNILILGSRSGKKWISEKANAETDNLRRWQ